MRLPRRGGVCCAGVTCCVDGSSLIVRSVMVLVRARGNTSGDVGGVGVVPGTRNGGTGFASTGAGTLRGGAGASGVGVVVGALTGGVGDAAMGVGTLRGGAGTGGVVGTLRGGIRWSGVASGVRAGTGWSVSSVSGASMLLSNESSCARARCCVSLEGIKGEPWVGLRRACAISRRLARMLSSVVAVGMVTLVGNQVSVSHMRMALVSHIQTR
jgi:hypothetical protein